MAKASEIKRVMRPFLAGQPDLGLVGRRLYVTPIQHFLRFVLLERSGDADIFRPQFQLMLQLIWRWSHKAMPDSLFQAIEDQALPVLRATSTFATFEGFTDAHPSVHKLGRPSWVGMLFNAALGRYDKAREAARTVRGGWKVDPSLLPRVRQYNELLHAMADALEREAKPEVIQLLHDMERHVAEKAKLQPYWEPSPFPLEIDA
jgi:hypothetical protein